MAYLYIGAYVVCHKKKHQAKSCSRGLLWAQAYTFSCVFLPANAN